MAISFASKTDIFIAVAQSFDMASATTKTETPVDHQRELGDLARMSFIKGNLYLRISGASGSATARLFAGSSELASVPVDFTSQADHYKKMVVDLSGLQGAELLRVEVECDSVGADGVVDAWLECEVPLIIST